MDYSWAVPGAKVVCVNNTTPGKVWWDDDCPRKGTCYTITSVHIDRAGEIVVWLKEKQRCQRSIDAFGPLVGYALRRFRPLITRTQRQDATMFRQLIGKMSPEERALALLLDERDAER